MSVRLALLLKDEALEVMIREAYRIDGPVSIEEARRDDMLAGTLYVIELDDEELVKIGDEYTDEITDFFTSEMMN